MHRRLIPALVLIALGSLFLLDNLGLAGIDVGRLAGTWWPALLVLAGVQRLLRRADGSVAAG